MKLLPLLILLFSSACARHRSPAQETTSPTEQLQAQFETYHSLAPSGWASFSSCDSLLFVSLQQVGLDKTTEIETARNDVGEWFRSPALAQDQSLCENDISRDMYTGLFVYIHHFKRLDLAEGIWDYGTDHAWVMGEDRSAVPDGRTIFTPNMISLLAELIHDLGGGDHPERFLPAVYSTEPGFPSHLSLLQLYLQGEMQGGLTDGELAVLRTIRGTMTLNPLVHALLHRYTDGDQTEATRLLLTIWPRDRLPTQADWSEDWRLQRADGDSGFLPGSGNAPHSGGDFLFAAAIVLGKA